MSLPAPLMFTVGLIDQITAPIAKISKGLNGLASNYQAGTMQMASGIGGIAASGYALQNALMPAIEMDRALGEVKSLGVRQSALKMLTDTSYEYALKYGKSATDFVKSSYDIQSAIAGLNDANLSKFTLSSNVLAAATKADAATVTSYMGTMYGIFKNDAIQMGEGAWIERLTGMTATAVQAFKTDGKKMADAFGALGASAGLAPLEEQMAIMGTLQATMQGSESATKYKSFLAGVGKAQKALNLQFTDANGTMLPIVDILNKIKGKYGDVIDVAEGDALATAFGSQEAVSMVKLLLNDINGLNGSIESLGKVKGMEQAEKMAAAMTDQSERLAQSWYVIRAALGSAVLPAFNSFVGWIADMGRDVIEFTQLYPELTKWLGYTAIAFTVAVMAGGAFTVMMGASKMAMAAWGVAAMAWAGITTVLSSGLATLRGVMLAVNIAMYANPIGLVVAGIALAVAAVGALIYYWDDLKATMSDWAGPLLWSGSAISKMFQDIGSAFSSMFGMYLKGAGVIWAAIKPLLGLLWEVQLFFLKLGGSAIFGVFSGLAFLVGGLATLVSYLANGIEWVATVITSALGEAIESISNLWSDLMTTFSDGIDWIVGMIPGVEIDASISSSTPSIAAISPVQTRVDKGGITQQISNANQQKSTSVGTVNVYPAKGENVSVPAMLAMYS